MNDHKKDDLHEKRLTLTEFRHELGIPFTLARRLIAWGIVEAKREVDGTLRIAASDLVKAKKILGQPGGRFMVYFRNLGPGLITGASDDDPSGIATYSSAGAQFGFGLLWMSLWLLPMMIAVQEVCARIGVITNKGLAAVLREHYGQRIVAGSVTLLLLANTVNIGADIGAIAASFNLIFSINRVLLIAFFTLMIVLLEIFVPYRTYAKILKWLTLSLFAYILTAVISKPDWVHVFLGTIIPAIEVKEEYVFAIVAIFGTTITPYLFFWQASEEVEEQSDGKKRRKLGDLKTRISWMHKDVYSGMALANLVSYFIILTTAQVLFSHGITNINSAEQAAEALKPLAGNAAFILFAVGIMGTGFLAIPILAGSSAYALSEVMHWQEGLNKKFSQARKFYLVIIISMSVGLLMNFIGISPIKALYYAAWLNGVVSIPLLFIIMTVGNDKRIVGEETNPLWIGVFGWVAFGFASLALLATFALQLRSWL